MISTPAMSVKPPPRPVSPASARGLRRRAALLIFQLERCMDAHYYGGWKDDRDAIFNTLVDIWVATLTSPMRGG